MVKRSYLFPRTCLKSNGEFEKKVTSYVYFNSLFYTRNIFYHRKHAETSRELGVHTQVLLQCLLMETSW